MNLEKFIQTLSISEVEPGVWGHYPFSCIIVNPGKTKKSKPTLVAGALAINGILEAYDAIKQMIYANQDHDEFFVAIDYPKMGNMPVDFVLIHHGVRAKQDIEVYALPYTQLGNKLDLITDIEDYPILKYLKEQFKQGVFDPDFDKSKTKIVNLNKSS